MNPPNITLREMRQDEYEAYTDLLDTEFAQSVGSSSNVTMVKEQARQGRLQHLPDGLATEGHRLLVAENAAGEPVGNAWIGFAEPRTGSPEMAWLYDIRVAESHRRSGYASAILAAVEGLAREAGASQLGLNVFGHNRPAISLYEASGFRVTAQQMAKRLR